jgi:glycine oxidase
MQAGHRLSPLAVRDFAQNAPGENLFRATRECSPLVSSFTIAGVKTWDVIVIGGGIIGLSVSTALRKKGASVLLIERGEPGREASHAAGGMLVDSPLETAPALQPLATASARMYPEFVRELELESRMKVDLRDFGTIFLPPDDHEGASAGPGLQPEMVHQLEPELAAPHRTVVYLQERCVDPRSLVAAAIRTAKARGVDFSSGDRVTAVNLSGGKVAGVTTAKTSFLASKVVNCAGAWSGEITLGTSVPDRLPTRPVKGQMIYLLMPRRELVRHVIRAPQAYLIPRSDGRLLVGTTIEEVGFDKRTDPSTIQRLFQAAVKLVPKLENAKLHEDWAGLRPGTPDALPILGATLTTGYFVATGHYRDGILLAPVTAQIMAQVIEGRLPPYDLACFSPARF